MPKIQENKIYRVKISKYQFDILPKEEIKRLIMDGRIGSKFIESLIVCYFKGFELSKNGNDYYDFKCGKILFEEKTLTINGLSLVPSGQLGKGRKFDSAKFLERKKKIDYYVIADVTSFPIIDFVFVRSGRISAERQRYSAKEAKRVFFEGKAGKVLNKKTN